MEKSTNKSKKQSESFQGNKKSENKLAQLEEGKGGPLKTKPAGRTQETSKREAGKVRGKRIMNAQCSENRLITGTHVWHNEGADGDGTWGHYKNKRQDEPGTGERRLERRH